jgi:hypothetical protein
MGVTKKSVMIVFINSSIGNAKFWVEKSWQMKEMGEVAIDHKRSLEIRALMKE